MVRILLSIQGRIVMMVVVLVNHFHGLRSVVMVSKSTAAGSVVVKSLVVSFMVVASLVVASFSMMAVSTVPISVSFSLLVEQMIPEVFKFVPIFLQLPQMFSRV